MTRSTFRYRPASLPRPAGTGLNSPLTGEDPPYPHPPTGE